MEDYFKQFEDSDRIQELRNHAIKMEDRVIPVTLSEKDLELCKDELSKLSITMERELEKKKEFMEEHRSIVKPLKLEIAEVLNAIRTGVRELLSDVYLVPDHEQGIMYEFDSEGKVLLRRSLSPDEKQLRIVPDFKDDSFSIIDETAEKPKRRKKS